MNTYKGFSEWKCLNLKSFDTEYNPESLTDTPKSSSGWTPSLCEDFHRIFGRSYELQINIVLIISTLGSNFKCAIFNQTLMTTILRKLFFSCECLASWFMESHNIDWDDGSFVPLGNSWTNVDQGPWRHMVSINHIELNNPTCWICVPWWRHQMGLFYVLLTVCAVNSPHKGQWRGALIFSLIYAWPSGWVNNRDAGDLRRHRLFYDVIIMAKASMVYVIQLNQHLATR